MPAWNVSVNSTAARFEMALRTQFRGRFATTVSGAGFARAGAAPTAADSSWPTAAVFCNVLAAPAPNHKPTATNKPAAMASTHSMHGGAAGPAGLGRSLPRDQVFQPGQAPAAAQSAAEEGPSSAHATPAGPPPRRAHSRNGSRAE